MNRVLRKNVKDEKQKEKDMLRLNEETPDVPPPPPLSYHDSQSSSRFGSPGISQPKKQRQQNQGTAPQSAVTPGAQRMPGPSRFNRGWSMDSYNSDDDVFGANKTGVEHVPGFNGETKPWSIVSSGEEDTIEVRDSSDPSKGGQGKGGRLQTAVPIYDDDDDDDGIGDGKKKKKKISEKERKKIEMKARADIEARIAATTTEVEVSYIDPAEVEKKKRQQRRQRLALLLCLLVIGILGAVIGVVLAKKEPAVDPTEVPTLLPTLNPTVRPLLFTPPPIASSPEQTPRQFEQTDCEGAFSVDTVLGETIFGEIDATARISPVDTCDIRRNGVGVWYQVQGGDNRRFVASTCGTSFDTQLSIYAGVCGKLRCLAGNDQSRFCGGNGAQSQVAFSTGESDQPYYIYVHSPRDSRGLFSLTVSNLKDNDMCPGAVSLSSSEDPFQYLFGSTRAATVDDDVNCESSSPTGPGVYYSVEGTGEYIQVSLVNGQTTGYQGEIFVFSSTNADCSTLTCISGPSSTSTTGGTTSKNFATVQGETYYILVHGPNEGDFEIRAETGMAPTPAPTLAPNPPTVFQPVFVPTSFIIAPPNGVNDVDLDIPPEEFPPPPNPDGTVSCAAAAGNPHRFRLELNGERYNSTTSPTFILPDEVFGSCGYLVYSTSSSRRWYTVLGTGNPLTVSTCVPSSLSNEFYLDTQLSVFLLGMMNDDEALEGNGGFDNCDTIQCIDGNDQFCFDQSSVTWFTKENVWYLIAVHGFDNREGPFSISLQDHVIEDNNQCQDAVDVTDNNIVNGVTILGNTDHLTVSSLSPSPPPTTYPTTFSYCGIQPTALDSDNDNVAFSGGLGTWYVVVGTGNRMTASTCDTLSLSASALSDTTGTTDDPSSFVIIASTSLSLFSGICNALACVEEDAVYSTCGDHTSVTWQSQFNVEYHILVWNPQNEMTDTTGVVIQRNFRLTVQDVPLGDTCENAIGTLLPNGSIRYGSTQGASSDYDLLFPLLSSSTDLGTDTDIDAMLEMVASSASVWYTVLGNGEELIASTCSQFTMFDSVVAVFGETTTTTTGTVCDSSSLTLLSLSLEISARNKCTVSWPSQLDEVYYVVIMGRSSTHYGNFGLTVTTTR